MNNISNINSNFFVSSFKDNENFYVDDYLLNYIANRELAYQNLSSNEISVVKELLKEEINNAKNRKVGEHRKGLWSDVWHDVLKKFEDSLFDINSLNPDFISKTKYLRFNGKYIKPVNKNFEMNFYEIIRYIISKMYFDNYENIYEFGCGSCFNLASFANTFPNKNFYGSDWTSSSKKIIDLLRAKHNLNINGFILDFFKPNKNQSIKSNSLFLTMCAFEQIGDNFDRILEFFLSHKPGLVVQLEPINEFYDRTNVFDNDALNYHANRNYLTNYFSRLVHLEKQNLIDILYKKRIGFGSFYQESYSLIVWRPKK